MKILSAHLKYTAAALAALLMLTCAACNAAELSSLRSFAKPYVGAYECTEARFGERDLLKEFPSVILTLEDGGLFVLEAVSAGGRKRTAKGRYEYTENSLLFTVTAGGRKHSKRVPIENGTFVIEQMFAGQKLILKFEVKG